MIRFLLHISLRGKIWGWTCIVNSLIELRLFIIEKGLSNCGKSLVSILFLALYTEELFTWFLYCLHESLIWSLAVKNSLVVGFVGERWVLASLNSSIKYSAPYVRAQMLAIFRFNVSTHGWSTFNFIVLLAQKTTLFLILMITENFTYPEKE